MSGKNVIQTVNVVPYSYILTCNLVMTVKNFVLILKDAELLLTF